MKINDPYATHLPVLHALGKILDIRIVLEYGVGVYSTPTFLDKSYYPTLDVLDTIEKYQVWADRMSERLQDYRWSFVDKPLDLWVYDLIFIDSGQSIDERLIDIQFVAKNLPANAHTVVIIHDIENSPYIRASSAFWGRFIYSRLTPHTGVFWNTFNKDLREVWRLLDD